MGAYPIQTNTSCANEWIEKGFMASSVENDSEIIFSLLDSIIKDRERLSISANTNFVLAKQMLDEDSIRESSKLFYT
jgi:hexokinase